MLLASKTGRRIFFDLVFLDPPYGKLMGQAALEAVRSQLKAWRSHRMGGKYFYVTAQRLLNM